MPVDNRRGTILIAILRYACYFTLSGCLFSFPVHGDTGPVEPFSVRNMNPFALIYGLPAASSTHLLPANESSLQLTGDVANNSIQSGSDGERIRLDGETYRLALIWKQGIAADWQFAVELPYIAHREGWMDGLIENWHDIFGLSNSNRDDWSRNSLLYHYESADGEQVLVNRGEDGVGDIMLSLSHALYADTDSGARMTLHGSLKLPTGDAGALLGSGAVDLAFWLSGEEQRRFWQWPLTIYGQGGLLLKGKGDLLQDIQRDLVYFGTLGVGWQPMEWLDLKLQVDAHSSHYDSDLDQLGGAALMLTVGGSIHLEGGLDGDSQCIDISIGENLTTDSVPDFMINLAYVRRFDGLGTSAQE